MTGALREESRMSRAPIQAGRLGSDSSEPRSGSSPQLVDGHGEESIADALYTVAVMQDDAARESPSRGILKPHQPVEIFRLHRRGGLHFDADDSTGFFQDEIDLDLIPVAKVTDR